jgi:hypothetical protein
MSKLSLKERAAQHRAKKENKLNYFLSNLTNITGCTLTKDGSEMTYIISPSNYKQGYYQLTTFIRNEPYCHTQEPTIIDLIKNNLNELINYNILEVC